MTVTVTMTMTMTMPMVLAMPIFISLTITVKTFVADHRRVITNCDKLWKYLSYIRAQTPHVQRVFEKDKVE